MLTDDERNRLNNAWRQLKNSGEYGRLAVIHKQVKCIFSQVICLKYLIFSSIF